MRVGVVGGGLMGSGIAEVCARSGVDVTVLEADDAGVARAEAAIEHSLDRAVKAGKLEASDREAAAGRLAFTTSFADVEGSDAAIEAVFEDEELKRRVFKQLDEALPDAQFLASNTSSVPIMKLGAETTHPGRVVGLHFFNPVPLMKLVEVVRTILTDEEVYESAVEFGRKLGKVPVRAGDKSGFIVNRLLVPYLLDSIRALEEGVGSIVDIDNGMKLGCGHPMGPLTLLDFVGLDTTYYIAEIMFDEFREKRFAPPPLLKRMVKAGLYGRKTGRGFYDYADPKKPVPLSLV
jgi:3-hydroxybutyryl-CoA dehydrogenase